MYWDLAMRQAPSLDEMRQVAAEELVTSMDDSDRFQWVDSLFIISIFSIKNLHCAYAANHNVGINFIIR